MAHRVTTIDALGPGVFRKLRQELGVTAFGVNAIVLPPGTEWFNHFHHRQDELYFVHAGTAGFEVEGDSFELGPGGAVHVEHDGEMVDPADVDRRRRFSGGDLDIIKRRDLK